MEFTYKANPTFARVHKDNSRFIFVRGPVGSGKSTGCVWHLLLHALRQPIQKDGVIRAKYAVVRATYPSLKSTTIKTWIDQLKSKIKIVYDTPIRGMVKFDDIGNGVSLEMEIVFLALETEQDLKKLQSLEITGAHINEAADVDESIFQMLKTRIGRYPAKIDGGVRDRFILCDYNSVSTDHWLYKIAEEVYPSMHPDDKALHSFYVQPPAVKLVNDRYVVNPDADNLEFLIDDYYTDMCAGNDPDFINVFVMNNYGEVRSGKPVYKDYDDSYHAAPTELEALSGVPIIIGLDQGLTPAAVFTQQSYDGQIRVIDEITTEDCSLQEFCEELLLPKLMTEYPNHYRSGLFYVVCDPATKQRSMNDKKAGTEVIKECGVPHKIAWTNVATTRREAVTTYLRRINGFILSPKCTMLRKGFISDYKYDEIKTHGSILFKEVPAKNEYSHPHDALQYAVLEYFRPRKKSFNFNKKQYSAVSTIGGY